MNAANDTVTTKTFCAMCIAEMRRRGPGAGWPVLSARAGSIASNRSGFMRQGTRGAGTGL